MSDLLVSERLLAAIDELASLAYDWDGYRAEPIDPRVIRAAKEFARGLPAGVGPMYAVVPMTGGRLQFEWHRRGRELEIEFGTDGPTRYLRCDDSLGVEEEGEIAAGDVSWAYALVHWFGLVP